MCYCRHMKTHHTKEPNDIEVRIRMPNGTEKFYYIPTAARQKLNSFLKELEETNCPLCLLGPLSSSQLKCRPFRTPFLT